jgi:hypothetical protein
MGIGENVGEFSGENTAGNSSTLFLAAPLNFYTGYVTDTLIQVSWTPPTKGAAIGYRIYNNATGLVVGTALWGETGATIAPLSPGTVYTFYVVTTDGINESEPSNLAQGMTEGGGVLDPPVITSITPLDGGALVYYSHSGLWTTPDSYEFFVNGVNTGNWWSATGDPKTISPLVNGVTVTITVKAWLDSGDSSIMSVGVPVTPQAAAPPVGVLFQDSFDTGATAPKQNGISWRSFKGACAVSSDNPRSGTHSLKFTWPGNYTGPYTVEARLGYDRASAYTELWIQYWVYYAPNFVHQANPSGGSSNNKFHDAKTFGEGVSLDYLSFNTEVQVPGAQSPSCRYRGRYDEGLPVGYNVPVNDYGTTNQMKSIPLATWTKIKFHYKVASRVGGVIQNDGVYQFWIDDVPVFDYTDMGAQYMACTPSSCGQLPAAVIPYALAQSNGPAPKLANSLPENAFFDYSYIFGAANSGFAEETYTWVDDLIIADNEAALNPPPSGVATIFTDNFETGNLSKTGNGFKWMNSSGGSGDLPPSISSLISHSGSYSLKFTFGGGADGDDALSEQYFSLSNGDSAGTPIYDHLFIEYWIYLPDGTEGNLGPAYDIRNQVAPVPTQTNNKYIRIWDDLLGYTNSREKIGTELWYSASAVGKVSVTYSGPTGAQAPVVYGGNLFEYSDLGKWVKVRWEFKMGSALGVKDGLYRVWKNNILIHEYTQIDNWQSNGRHGWNWGYLMGASSSGFDQTTNVFIDDITFYGSSSSAAPITLASAAFDNGVLQADAGSYITSGNQSLISPGRNASAGAVRCLIDGSGTSPFIHYINYANTSQTFYLRVYERVSDGTRYAYIRNKHIKIRGQDPGAGSTYYNLTFHDDRVSYGDSNPTARDTQQSIQYNGTISATHTTSPLVIKTYPAGKYTYPSNTWFRWEIMIKINDLGVNNGEVAIWFDDNNDVNTPDFHVTNMNIRHDTMDWYLYQFEMDSYSSPTDATGAAKWPGDSVNSDWDDILISDTFVGTGAPTIPPDPEPGPYTPILDRNFDCGTVGATANSPTCAFNGTGALATYSDEVTPTSGTLVAKCGIEANTTGFGLGWGGLINWGTDLPHGTTFWYKADFRYPAGFDFYTLNGQGLKTMRMRGWNPNGTDTPTH